LTDVLSADFPAGGTFFLRTNVSYTALAFSPVGFNASLGGTAEQAYKSSNATSQVYSTGALAAGTNGTTITAGYGPLTFLGRPTAPCSSVIGLGDSIFFGQGDASGGNAAGARGWFQRGLATAQTNGLPVAYAMEARPSDTPAQNTRSNSWRKRAMWKYANVLVCGLGINQLGQTSQAAQLAYLQDIWLSGRRERMQVWQTLITPQTTSTIGFAIKPHNQQWRHWLCG